MSSDNHEADENNDMCASCGVAEVDDIKLKNCTACYLVKYCSIECQKDHRKQHKDACKKRAAKLRDEVLFKQPENTNMGDCPICAIALPLVRMKSTMYPCCGKIICNGCCIANQVREFEENLQHKCPFCREPASETEEGRYKQMMKRINMNDPAALNQHGVEHYNKGDYIGAFEHWTKAAELGDADAHYQLALLYHDELGVEKDRGKEMYHSENAAIGGHPGARYNLGSLELKNGNLGKAVKHFVIAATQGDDRSIKALMYLFKEGFVSKEDLAAALRAHQVAIDATKSPQREEAEEHFRELELEEMESRIS